MIYVISFSSGSLIVSHSMQSIIIIIISFINNFVMINHFRLAEILAESKEGTELKKILNPHFGK